MNGPTKRDLLGGSVSPVPTISIKQSGMFPPSSSSGKKRCRQEGARILTTSSSQPDAEKKFMVDEKISSPVDLLKTLFSLNDSTKTWMEQQQDFAFSRPSDEAVENYDMTVVRAIRQGDADKLRDMLREGRKFDASNKFGESLLHMACRRGSFDVIKFLIEEAGVNLSIADDFGRTPLHDACWTSRPNLDVVELLLKKVPPNMFLTCDVRGHTPFHYARKEHWPTWVRFLRDNAHIILKRVSLVQSIQLLE